MASDWIYSQDDVDWDELSSLYVAAGMGNKAPADIKTAFTNSMFKCFVYDSGKLIGVGRALADGFDAAYICDIAVHPDYQGQGIGSDMMRWAVERAKARGAHIVQLTTHKSRADAHSFYERLGFKGTHLGMKLSLK